MAALPSNIRAILGTGTTAETPQPNVDRSTMDRGPAIQRLNNQRVMSNLQIVLLFAKDGDVEDFLQWYRVTIGVIGWFTMKHPRTGVQITARFIGGALGDITPVVQRFAIATVQTTIEYYPT